MCWITWPKGLDVIDSKGVDGSNVNSHPKTRVELERFPVGGVSSAGAGGFVLRLPCAGIGVLFLLLPFDTLLGLFLAGCLCFCLEGSEIRDGEGACGAGLADGGSVAVMVDMITKVVSTRR